jgi:anti-anti-sigma factor
VALRIDVTPKTLDATRSATVVRFVGVLDAPVALQAQAAIAQVTATRPKTVVLDLEQLEFIDSSGISVVLLAKIECAKIGAELLVTNMQRSIHRVFATVRVLPSVSVFASMADLDAYLARVQEEK